MAKFDPNLPYSKRIQQIQQKKNYFCNERKVLFLGRTKKIFDFSFLIPRTHKKSSVLSYFFGWISMDLLFWVLDLVNINKNFQ